MVLSIIRRYNRKFMKLKLLGVGIIAMMILIGYLFLFFVLPSMFSTSLYYISNWSSESHIINVEIFDEDNVSVLKEIYNLAPEENIKYERRIGWGPTITWEFLTWSSGTYTFHFTVDNIYSEWYTTEVTPYCGQGIWLFYKDHHTNETIPIEIREFCS
jgi:hypothetical protein